MMNNQFHFGHFYVSSLRVISAQIIALMTIIACATAEEVQTPSAPTAPANAVAENSVLPSSLVYYIHTQNYLQPDWKQDDIASSLLPLARVQGLDDYERFFLAQLNFMAFEGDAAYEMFAEFTARDDWYGWMARMRHAIIDARFYGNFERLERGIKYERENFPFDPEFSDMPGFGERSLCAQWAEDGDHGRAVELALTIIAATPKDAPYGTFRVIEACYSSFEEIDREEEAFALAQSILDDLTAALALRKAKADQHPEYETELFENIIEDWWYHRSVRAPYNYLNHNYEQMINRLEKFLICHRDDVSDACPV